MAPAIDSRAKVIGDACLLTAAVFAVASAIGGALVVLSGVSTAESAPPPTGVGAVLQVVASFLLVVTLVAGPAVSWLLHGRRIRAAAILGAILGAVAGVVVIQAFFLLAMLVGTAIARVTGVELAGPIAILVVVSVGFCALVVWLDIDAVRDLSPARREHRRLDIARIVATLVVVLFSAATIGISVMNPGTEIGEAGIFALAAGAFGAVLTAVADGVASLADRRASGASEVDSR